MTQGPLAVAVSGWFGYDVTMWNSGSKLHQIAENDDQRLRVALQLGFAGFDQFGQRLSGEQHLEQRRSRWRQRWLEHPRPRHDGRDLAARRLQWF
jgi:hypothetical protein